MNKLVLSCEEQNTIDEIINLLMKANLARQADCSQWKEYNFFDWCRDNHNLFESHDLYVNSGATKMVFLSPHLTNWVIKVPFIYGVNNADGVFHYTNACDAEARIYGEAVEAEVDEYFAAMFYYKTIDGVPFYLQAKAECNDSKNEDVFFSSVSASYDRDDFEDEDDYYEAINSEVDYMDDTDRVVSFFGGDWIDDLMAFIENRELNDFHSANFGFIGIRPVLVDYSGY